MDPWTVTWTITLWKTLLKLTTKTIWTAKLDVLDILDVLDVGSVPWSGEQSNRFSTSPFGKDIQLCSLTRYTKNNKIGTDKKKIIVCHFNLYKFALSPDGR